MRSRRVQLPPRHEDYSQFAQTLLPANRFEQQRLRVLDFRSRDRSSHANPTANLPIAAILGWRNIVGFTANAPTERRVQRSAPAKSEPGCGSVWPANGDGWGRVDCLGQTRPR